MPAPLNTDNTDGDHMTESIASAEAECAAVPPLPETTGALTREQIVDAMDWIIATEGHASSIPVATGFFTAIRELIPDARRIAA